MLPSSVAFTIVEAKLDVVGSSASSVRPMGYGPFYKLLIFLAGHFSTSVSRLDYYEDLGIDQNADSKKIKEAYYSLSKQFHPDLNPENPEAYKRFHVRLFEWHS